MKPIIDYLIVIPLDEEFRYVREVIQDALAGGHVQAKTIGPHLYALTQLPTGAAHASAVVLSVGRMTEGPVQSAVEAAVREWRPATVILLGIAGSLEPDKIKLGDVFVPSKVFGYTEAKAEVVGGEQRMTYRPTGDRLDCELLAQARAVYLNDFSTWQAESLKVGLQDAALNPKLKAVAGPNIHMTDNDCLASGNTVVASKAFAKSIQAALGPTVKAVEMEAKGLCEALAKIRPAPAALVVRGISDFADEEKAALEKDTKDGWRRWAAQNAARFALRLVECRPSIAEGYCPVGLPSYSLQPHRDSAAICLKARIIAREKGMRALAFSPFLNGQDGIAATQLTFEAVDVDGARSAFADFLLRHSDDYRVLKRTQGQGYVTHRLERTGELPPLELLVGLPASVTTINLTAIDEFGRTARTVWSPNVME